MNQLMKLSSETKTHNINKQINKHRNEEKKNQQKNKPFMWKHQLAVTVINSIQ